MPLGSGNATKTFTYLDGSWTLTNNYKAGKWFKGFEIPIANIGEAFEILKENEKYPVFMIQGGFIEGVNKQRMLRRKRGDREDGEKPTIADRYLQLFCFDVDGYKDGEVEDFIKELPPEFHSCSYIYQYSASYGLVDKEDGLKCHIFFWLSTPVMNTEIEDWLKECGIESLDPSVLRAAQPIYTQRRVCYGKSDPIDENIFLVSKEVDELEWKPKKSTSTKVEKVVKTDTTHSYHTSDKKLDVSESVRKIMSSEDYHNELNRLALSLVNKRMPHWDIKELLKGMMEAIEVKDQRWTDRYNDIDRAVNSAVEIVKNPTVDELLEWIDTTSIDNVKADFAHRCLRLNAIDLRTVTTALESKLNIGIRAINSILKEEKKEDRRLTKLEQAKRRKAKRAENGITEIELTVDNRNEVHNQCCELLANSKKDPEVFSMGGSLASIYYRKPETIRQCRRMYELGEDYPFMPIISVYKKPYCDLGMRLNMDAIMINQKGKDIETPYSVLNNIAMANHPAFRPLSGIVEHPFINREWKLVSRNGYDDETGLFAVLHKKLKLTRMDPQEAYRYITEEVFAEFPFKSNLDEAVAVGAMMTGVQRPVISGDSGFPGFGIVSPTQSSGKTTLAQVISYAVFNRPIAATTMSGDDTEFAKHLLSILQEGHACVLFDNITQGKAVKSDTLAKIITGDSYIGRQLGENKVVRVPNNTLWIFTGNGITFVGDFATRILPINLYPRMKNPETRSFKRGDIGEWVADNRKKIMSAVLSIVMAGKECDKNMEVESSRFKLWDRFVRIPLMKVTGVDIAVSLKHNQAFDTDYYLKYSFLDEMKRHFGNEKFTTKELVNAAKNGLAGGNSDLQSAMNDWVGSEYTTLKSIGRRLNTLAGEVCESYMLEKYQSNFCKWRVLELSDSDQQ